MPLTSKTVDTVNRETQRLPISAERLDELPVELGQFAAVMARVHPQVDFDQDPSDFARALAPTAAKTTR